MRLPAKVIGLAAGLCVLSGRLSASELAQLKVLYVGDVGSARAKQFEIFLSQYVGHVTVAAREGFKPSEAADSNVVLLDWPQSAQTQEEWKAGYSPLGNRAQWNKPTVLLGSAGLNLAVVWKIRDGAG